MHVAEIEVVQVELVRVSSVGKVIAILSKVGSGALTVNVLVSIMLRTEDESKTSWLFIVYPTLRLIGCIVTLAVPLYM